MVNTLRGSVSAYRQESVNQRFIRIDEVMDLINATRDEAMDIALAAGARHQLAKITLVHKDCMHCKFFWGHNNRCANGTCCKPSKKKEQNLPAECVGCPYYQGNGYCFPCMRKLIGK